MPVLSPDTTHASPPAVLAFDLDDTLAVSKSPIDPTMVALLGGLLDRVEVCIISGGRFENLLKHWRRD